MAGEEEAALVLEEGRENLSSMFDLAQNERRVGSAPSGGPPPDAIAAAMEKLLSKTAKK